MNEEISSDSESSISGDPDVSDEMRIKFAISEFNEVANTINRSNKGEIVAKLKARRNVLINMMQIYLSKFNNQPIMDDFFDALSKAKKEAVVDGMLHKYLQFLNETRVIGTFLGIRENISDKLSEQLLSAMKTEEHEKLDILEEF